MQELTADCRAAGLEVLLLLLGYVHSDPQVEFFTMAEVFVSCVGVCMVCFFGCIYMEVIPV